jgi:hypothetical protein
MKAASVTLAAASLALLLSGATLVAGQEAGLEDRAALFGGWRLNREQSAGARNGESTGDEGRRPGGPPGQGGQRGGGGFQGRGGRGGSFGGGGGGRGLDPEQMQQARDLMRELMTPAAHWVITSGAEGVITLVDETGRSTRITANNKKERHQLTAGTIDTRTKWDNGLLSQEIEVSGGMKITRTFRVEPTTNQLIVSTTSSGGRGGRAPMRFIYDRDDL